MEAVESLIAGSAFGYVVIAALVAGDGVLPVVPGETALIGGAVLAAAGELELAGVILAGIAGGLIGDNASYALGAHPGRRAADRLFRSDRSQRRLVWARDQIEERGRAIILTARFIPVGRTATTFAAGMLAMPWRRFAPIDALAVLAWSLYASLLGYYGGRALGDSPWEVLLATLVAAALIGIVAELLARARGA